MRSIEVILDIKKLYKVLETNSKLMHNNEYFLSQKGLSVKYSKEDNQEWYDILKDGRLVFCNGEAEEFDYDKKKKVFFWTGNDIKITITEEEMLLLDNTVIEKIRYNKEWNKEEKVDKQKRVLFADKKKEKDLTPKQRASKKYAQKGRKIWLETETGKEYLERENSEATKQRRMTANAEVGNYLINERLKQGKSREEVAERLGVSYDLISKWESGLSRPQYLHAIALADFLNFPYKPFRKMLSEAEKEAERLLKEEGK